MNWKADLLETHNGTIFITNPETGGYRTFKIYTQPLNSDFAPGARIIKLCQGPDNDSDYKSSYIDTPFGFILDNGKISIWRKHRNSVMNKYADMIQNPGRYAGKVSYQFRPRCRACNRMLKTIAERENGINDCCQ